MTQITEKSKAYNADTIQWMHFAAVKAGQSLENLEQTIEGRKGLLGKRLRDALADLFDYDDPSDIIKLELLVFDAEDEYAWINPELFYFIPASKVTAEFRFPASKVWKALLGALVITNQEEAEPWFSLSPGKKNYSILKNSQVFRSNTSEIQFRMLELLLRGVSEQKVKVNSEELTRLMKACREADQEAAEKLEVIAWQMGNANLWRFALSVADGKNYLARIFEDRLVNRQPPKTKKRVVEKKSPPHRKKVKN